MEAVTRTCAPRPDFTVRYMGPVEYSPEHECVPSPGSPAPTVNHPRMDHVRLAKLLSRWSYVSSWYSKSTAELTHAESTEAALERTSRYPLSAEAEGGLPDSDTRERCERATSASHPLRLCMRGRADDMHNRRQLAMQAPIASNQWGCGKQTEILYHSCGTGSVTRGETNLPMVHAILRQPSA